MGNEYRSSFLISLDFELWWGVHDSKSIEEYRGHLEGGRHAVEAILELFEKFEVNATWAAVGFLFCEGREELLEVIPETLPEYRRRHFSPYRHIDGIGANEREAPFHFAPSLIRAIADVDGQEIATHTFSHYYCLEEGQTPEAFRADLRVAHQVARRRGVTLESIVFPRNQVSPAHLEVCRDSGLVAFRGNQQGWAHRARNHNAQRLWHRGLRLADAYLPVDRSGTDEVEHTRGLINVPASRFLRPYNPTARHLEPLRIRRIKGEMSRAAQAGSLYHLWWHPHNFGVHLDENLRVLRRLLVHYRELNAENGMQSRNMAQVAEAVAEPAAGEPESH